MSLIKIKWIGPEGVNPDLGIVERGKEFTVDSDFADILIRNGCASPIKQENKKKDKE